MRMCVMLNSAHGRDPESLAQVTGFVHPLLPCMAKACLRNKTKQVYYLSLLNES